MRILHYFLGFPPYRTGGLTKYAFDLMNSQAEMGEKVAALWPGRMRLLYSGVSVKKKRNVGQIENYELINPLPVPLDEGIVCQETYTKPCDKTVYRNFLSKLRPDVIHIHTLMGLHRELVAVAGEMGIRTVFTTHDYFGICPKVTLYRQGAACEQDHNCEDCVQCNRRALSVEKIWMMQSPMYRYLKDSFIVKWLRKYHRMNYFSEKTVSEPQMPKEMIAAKSKEYQKLREYYCGMLSAMDMIHFNSSVSEMVYKRYIVPKDSRVITITHRDIRDNRKKHVWEPEKILKLSYLSPARPAKGFYVLKKALDEVWDSGWHDFTLKVFTEVSDRSPYMIVKEGGYQYSELESIFADTDVLIVPSVWYETFGFTVLEAISYGVPVIVSDHVGAKDVVGDGGIVISSGLKESIKDTILSLTSEKLKKMRESIYTTANIKMWDQFVCENNGLYRSRTGTEQIRKIKVLQIGCENFGAGGRSVIIYNLVRNMGPDFRIDFFSSSEVKKKSFQTEIEEQGGKVKVYIDDITVNKLMREVLRARAICQIMREENYDIVHINADDAWEAAKSEIYARRAGIKKIVVHGHSAGSAQQLKLLKRLIIFFSKWYVKKDADQKIACSFQAAEYLFGKRGLNDILILKNGINIEKFLFNRDSRRKIREDLEVSDDHIVIGCVGRMSEEKNPLFMLEVMRWIVKANEKVLMIWVGDGSLRSDMIEKILEFQLEDYVKLMGNRNNVYEIFQAMDIFVLPSLYEGFGIVNLEAQASGLPCVVSEGIPEMAKINENFYRIPLEKGEKYWANFILHKTGSRIKSGIGEKFKKYGYDISCSSDDLKKCYERLTG